MSCGRPSFAPRKGMLGMNRGHDDMVLMWYGSENL